MPNTSTAIAPFLFLLALASVTRAQAATDTVRIISVTPGDSLQMGVPTTLKVDVETVLHSADSGSVRIGFNGTVPKGWGTRDSHVIHAGTERVTFVVNTVPVDWGSAGSFSMAVSIADAVTPAPRSRPTVVIYHALPVRP